MSTKSEPQSGILMRFAAIALVASVMVSVVIAFVASDNGPSSQFLAFLNRFESEILAIVSPFSFYTQFEALMPSEVYRTYARAAFLGFIATSILSAIFLMVPVRRDCESYFATWRTSISKSKTLETFRVAKLFLLGTSALCVILFGFVEPGGQRFDALMDVSSSIYFFSIWNALSVLALANLCMALAFGCAVAKAKSATATKDTESERKKEK